METPRSLMHELLCFVAVTLKGCGEKALRLGMDTNASIADALKT